VVVGVDARGDLDPAASKPLDERAGGFAPDPSTLPGDADHPRHVRGEPAISWAGDGGLDCSHGRPPREETNDPIEPHLGAVRVSGDEVAIPIPEFLAGERTSGR
jgi:hypothetical protein